MKHLVETTQTPELVSFMDMPIGSFGTIKVAATEKHQDLTVFRAYDAVVCINNGDKWSLPCGVNRVKLLKPGDTIKITVGGYNE